MFMNTKKTLEEIGFITVKMNSIMNNIELGEYTVEIGVEYLKLSTHRRELVKQIQESTIILSQRIKPIPQQKKEMLDKSGIERMSEYYEREYNEAHERPLPSEQKRQLERLL